MSIVIVDDSVTNLIVLKHLAKGHGNHAVTSFTDPVFAKEFLEVAPAELIIVDCEMPGLNGVEFIAAVRLMSRHNETPILMVTHHSDAEIRRNALNAGATDFLSKPVDAAEFKVRVRNLLQLRSAAHSAA